MSTRCGRHNYIKKQHEWPSEPNAPHPTELNDPQSILPRCNSRRIVVTKTTKKYQYTSREVSKKFKFSSTKHYHDGAIDLFK
jgi:hypothetical protein